MNKQTTAYIGLGSNLGDRRRYIDTSIKMLDGAPELDLRRVSDVIETAPLTEDDQPSYLNAVAEVETGMDAHGLLKTLGEIEILLGRRRAEKWEPRIIDLDLLLFGREVVKGPNLTVPHPQMHLRSFVLNGLCQLDPQLPHPVLAEPVVELASRLNGGDFAPDPAQPGLVSVAGIIGVGKTTLAKKLAEAFKAPVLLEPYETNPYLADVYAGKTELALDSQLFFLNARVEQLGRNKLAAGKVVVSDYVFEKELIYARRLLEARQLEVYQKTYGPLAGKAAAPVLVIYLKDSAQRCLEQIHRRNRPYEQGIELEFLRGLSEDYERLFEGWRRSPVIRVDMSRFDCSDRQAFKKLANQVRFYVECS